MSTLRLLICVLVLLSWGKGETPPALAQSGERPIYLYQGQGASKGFRWIDRPSEATAYVFREPVTGEEDSGRIIARADDAVPSLEEVARRLPAQDGHLTDSTTLMYRSHPIFDGEAIGTQDEYPAQGEDVRYFLLIERGERLYASRTVGGRLGNLPRYHTLGSPAHVRVGQLSETLRPAADTLLRRVQEGEDTAEDSAEEAATPIPANEDSGGSFANSVSALVARSLSGSALWWGGSGLFGGLMFLLGMTAAGGRRSEDSGSRSSRRGSGKKHPPHQGGSMPSLPGSQEESSGGEESATDSDPEERLRERIEELEEELRKAKEGIAEMYRDEVRPLQQRLDEIEKRLKDGETAEEKRDSRGEQVTPAEAVAVGFVKWCQNAGSRARRVEEFRDFLTDKIQAEEVREIQYEKDSASDEFGDDARNGITYWLVRMDGQQYVLPSLLNSSQFDKLSPVFEGRSKPDTIEGIQPASLGRQAGRLVLDEKGKVW
jgi:hypothetical protein